MRLSGSHPGYDGLVDWDHGPKAAGVGDLKVVILCGGLGTRLREETEYRPEADGRDRRAARCSGTS